MDNTREQTRDHNAPYELSRITAQVSALARPIDPSYPTNRYVIALTVLAALVGGGVAALDGANILAGALWTALATVSAWAIGREIDPAYDYAAFVGAGIALVTGAVAPPFSLLAVLVAIMLARALNRCVGTPLKLTDTAAIVLLTGLTVLTTEFWTIGLVAIIALLVDVRLNSPLYPRNRAHALAALVVAGVVAVAGLVNGFPLPGESDTLLFIGVAVVTGAFAWAIYDSREVVAVADATGDPLNPLRVQWGMIVVLLAGVFLLWHGEDGLIAAMPLWAAMAGTVVYRLWLRLRA